MEGQDMGADKEEKEKSKKTGKEGLRKRGEKGIGVRGTWKKKGGGRTREAEK